MPDQPTMTAREAAELLPMNTEDVLANPFDAGMIVQWAKTCNHPGMYAQAAEVIQAHHAARQALYREAVELLKEWVDARQWADPADFTHEARSLLGKLEEGTK